MMKIGNFSMNALTSAFHTEGWFYDYHFNDGSEIQLMPKTKTKIEARSTLATVSAGKCRYEFAFIPNNGFLNSPELLLKNCELKISFDRANPNIALCKVHQTSVAPSKIEIIDCVAITEYVSSPGIRSFFDMIEREPVTYEYEDMEVLVKTLPTDSTNIQIDNIRGGNVPNYLFAALIPTTSLQGVYDKGATCFKQHHVEEFNLTLSGNSVSGYPMKVKQGCPTFPMQKFLDTTGHLYNVFNADTVCHTSFRQWFWFWSHKFEAETTSQGWLGITLKLTQQYTEQMSLVIWIVSPNGLTIDKYHQIEKINL